MKDEKWFWGIIDKSRGGKKSIDHERQISNLTKILSSLAAEDILSFNDNFNDLLQRSYTWELWGAVYIINEGCSDDTFDYFRSWLIGQGERRFYDAIANPEILKEMIKPGKEREWEGLGYCAADAYEYVTGNEIQDADLTKENENPGPKGKKWKEEELPSLFPGLWQAFSAHTNYGPKAIQIKKIDPSQIAADFLAPEIPAPVFWLNELNKRGHDVGLRLIGEPASDPTTINKTNYSGYLIQLKSRMTKAIMGILVKDITLVKGRVYVEFENFDKKLPTVLHEIGLILCDQEDVKIKTGNMEFTSAEWRNYLESTHSVRK